MRVTALVVVMCGALIATGAVAQVEVTVPEAGRVKTTAKVENGILGVANSFTRFRGTARECVGACFYANTTKTRVWTFTRTWRKSFRNHSGKQLHWRH